MLNGTIKPYSLQKQEREREFYFSLFRSWGHYQLTFFLSTWKKIHGEKNKNTADDWWPSDASAMRRTQLHSSASTKNVWRRNRISFFRGYQSIFRLIECLSRYLPTLTCVHLRQTSHPMPREHNCSSDSRSLDHCRGVVYKTDSCRYPCRYLHRSATGNAIERQIDGVAK